MPLSKPQNSHVLSQFSLKGKNAIVTGGSRGIGYEVVVGLAEAGANVAFTYSTTKDADAIAAKIASETGVIVKAYHGDVRNVDSIKETINKITAEFGSLHVVVANAGIATHIDALNYTPEQFSEIMRVNLDGAFYTAQAAGQIFKKQGYGNVIFTASVSAILVNVPQKQMAYNASKAGVVQMARCLAVEWVDFARVNCISPGFIATDMLSVHPEEWRKQWFSMIPAARLCDPCELKGAYVFLASDASSYMTGANMVIDGAYTLP
ncbi:oxidoreductase-1 [Coleophoma cylindrospora]|uniref:Oxidoreductase-1 n=1 Tax=Coleophoma cylindrospora TaxID=1849047 RepID=A0A3D8R264_9HELO|nr:oxidoreductase-1 [Coleophoma cylindrospora]